jgi:hypothetical protein
MVQKIPFDVAKWGDCQMPPLDDAELCAPLTATADSG